MLIDWAWDICGVLSAPKSTIHLWSSSNAVLKTSFSFWERKSKWETEPWLVVILDHVSSSFLPYFSRTSVRYLFLTLKDPESVLWV